MLSTLVSSPLLSSSRDQLLVKRTIECLILNKRAIGGMDSSETSVVRAATSGEISGVDEFELTLATNALFREFRKLWDLRAIFS
ncbi:hypothetical protein Tco_0689252 [Tanacetum coccineum]